MTKTRHALLLLLLVSCLRLPLSSQVKQTTANLGVANVFAQPNQFTLGALLGPITFLTLPSEVNGLQIYCSDCQQTNPCVGSGTGAMATGIAGAWSCASGGSGGGITGSGTLNQVGIWSGATSMTGSPSLTYNSALHNSPYPFSALIIGNPADITYYGGYCIITGSTGYVCLVSQTAASQLDVAFPLSTGATTKTMVVSASAPIFEDAYGNLTCPTCLLLVTSFTTTAATSDNVSVPGMLVNGHCRLQATNSVSAAMSGVYVSNKTTDQITVTHPVTASGNFDVMCTSY